MLVKPSLLARVAQEKPLAHDRFAAGLLDASSQRESSIARKDGVSTPQTKRSSSLWPPTEDV